MRKVQEAMSSAVEKAVHRRSCFTMPENRTNTTSVAQSQLAKEGGKEDDPSLRLKRSFLWGKCARKFVTKHLICNFLLFCATKKVESNKSKDLGPHTKLRNREETMRKESTTPSRQRGVEERRKRRKQQVPLQYQAPPSWLGKEDNQGQHSRPVLLGSGQDHQSGSNESVKKRGVGEIDQPRALPLNVLCANQHWHKQIYVNNDLDGVRKCAPGMLHPWQSPVRAYQ